ncbi:MAG: DUF6069 family protein [Halobacteriales archaeon]|nr:DUF6069 family protein [Halobacteriales archaeon]
MTETAVRQPPRSAQLRWAGPLAIGIGVAVNGALFLIAEAFGVFPADVVDPGSGRPFALTTVVIATAVGAFGATVTYAVLDRLVTDADRWFRITAGVVLLASFATPFTIPGAPPAMIGLLLVMHTVVAGVSVWLFTVRGVD